LEIQHDTPYFHWMRLNAAGPTRIRSDKRNMWDSTLVRRLRSCSAISSFFRPLHGVRAAGWSFALCQSVKTYLKSCGCLKLCNRSYQQHVVPSNIFSQKPGFAWFNWTAFVEKQNHSLTDRNLRGMKSFELCSRSEPRGSGCLLDLNAHKQSVTAKSRFPPTSQGDAWLKDQYLWS